MANSLDQRPFDDFRVAVTDPAYFVGRQTLLAAVLRSPCQVRILLGGRRIGKTSFLRAVEWSLLEAADPSPNQDGQANLSSSWTQKYFPTFSGLFDRSPKSELTTGSYDRRSGAFPVFINFQVEPPQSLDNLRYLLIARLREAIERWRQVPGAVLRQMYRQFLSQVAGGEVTLSFLTAINVKLNISNPDSAQKLTHTEFRAALLKTIHELQAAKFDGVCFLLDGAELITKQAWANDAWSYLRGLKDTDTAIKPFLGLLLSGYRDLKDYQQAVGSPLLNIADVEWLPTLSIEDMQHLILDRCQGEAIELPDAEIQAIKDWSGGHPYLLQQALNLLFNHHHQGATVSLNSIKLELLRQHDRDFSAWWNAPDRAYSFGKQERLIYRTLAQRQQGTPEELAQASQLSYGEVADILEVLQGTGVILRSGDETYQIGSQIFQEWVEQQSID